MAREGFLEVNWLDKWQFTPTVGEWAAREGADLRFTLKGAVGIGFIKKQSYGDKLSNMVVIWNVPQWFKVQVFKVWPSTTVLSCRSNCRGLVLAESIRSLGHTFEDSICPWPLPSPFPYCGYQEVSNRIPPHLLRWCSATKVQAEWNQLTTYRTIKALS